MNIMKVRLIRIARVALAAGAVATLIAACAQGGSSTDGSAVPSGSIKAYGVIDEGISVTR
jgi:hypothetical protein